MYYIGTTMNNYSIFSKGVGMKKNTATLSKDANKLSWCIIFRHPVRTDKAGKPGYRVRRGLNTKDKAEAQQLVDQMNEILAEESNWSLSAKAEAEKRYDARIVSAFYDSM